MTLDAEAFRRFFTEVNGVEPFPWQTDMVDQVLTERLWPSLVDVPTGMGKTALIDIAVFVAAATAAERGPDRLGRRRVLFVVDRRIVVDEAYERARQLSEALQAALAAQDESATRLVTLGLQSLAPTAGGQMSAPPDDARAATRPPALAVTRMRGGVTWDAAWLERPDLPAVVVGTVDQLGSRLLFRGYGVSDRRKPIDAALVGTDSLVLVDEAHLAEVMVTTLAEAQARDPGDVGVPKAVVVQLTATPSPSSRRMYAFDVDAHRRHPEAWRRLTATRQLALLAVEPKRAVEELSKAAERLVTGGAKTVLVVCNTVGRARAVHDMLTKRAGAARDPLAADVDLLIGRSRPADRDVLVDALRKRFGVYRSRHDGLRPAVLVATQTVEVGANFDADALVTESAPWDALVQRLGRLNRLGKTPGAQATVVHDGIEDPVYGAPRMATWETLSSLSRDAATDIDVSPLACRALAQQMPAEAFGTRPAPPLLLSPILDAWTRTGPIPLPDAPVAPYLHGLDRHPATVSIAWREGMMEPDPAGEDAELPDDEIDADLGAVPVLPAELVDVPIYAARSWLAGEGAASVSDLEDAELPSGATSRRVGEPFRGAVWRSGGDQLLSGAWRWVEAQDIRPGDTIVVPVERGGLDRYGWAPDSSVTVLDVADAVRFSSGPATARRRRLRVDSNTPRRLALGPEDTSEFRRRLRALASDDDDDRGVGGNEAEFGTWLRAAIDHTLDEHADATAGQRLNNSAWTPEGLRTLQAWLASGVKETSLVDHWERSYAEVGYRRQPGEGRFLMGASHPNPLEIERDDELVECSSMGARRVPLRVHHLNVGNRARDIATAIGLPRKIAASVEAAARWHDLGKLEERFQAMLCGGDRFDAMLVEEPLAKSGADPNDRAAWRRSRIRSGLPAGARHEAWSSAIVQAYLAAIPTENVDPDLVIHLVASHHGHARPWLPAVSDDDPRAIVTDVDGTPIGGPLTNVAVASDRMVDFDHPLRFARLNRRYGRWGLALLETVVRSSDMTVSAEGS